MFDRITRPVAAPLFALTFAVSTSVIVGSPAAAATLYSKFYAGPGTGPAYNGVYSGSGTVYSNTATSSCSGTCFTGTNTLMPAGDNPLSGSTDFTTGAGVTQTFSSNGLTIGATANTGNGVWNDLSPNFGGLGTGLVSEGSDADQIAGTEALTLTFSATITLDGVGTPLDSPHLDFGPNFTTSTQVSTAAPTMKFLLSVNGGTFQEISFLLANSISLNSLNLTGNTFTFMEDTPKDRNGNYVNPEFYVSALAYERTTGGGNQNTVPLPAAFPLFASGLGVLGFLAKRRKRRGATAIAV